MAIYRAPEPLLSHVRIVAGDGRQQNERSRFGLQSLKRQSRILSYVRIVALQRLNEEDGYAGWLCRGLRLDLSEREQTEGNDDDGRVGGTNQLYG